MAQTDIKEQATEASTDGTKLITIIVPVHNEQENIKNFVTAVHEVFETTPSNIHWDVLFVNDGSRDETELVIRSLEQNDKRIKLVNLSRNFGKEAALSAGLEYALGDAVIPMDVDLQDEPSIIPTMIEKWLSGADVVNARRRDRSADSWAKRTTAAWFYRVYNALADHPMPRNVGDFRLFDRKVVEVLKSMGEKARLNKALFSWVGFETQDVYFDRPERAAGETTMGYWKLWNMALDGIFSSTTKPLRIWTYVGGFVAIAAFTYAAFIFLRTIIWGVDVPGYASTLLLILSFGGLQFIAIGIIGEYVGRILTEVRERPLFVVRSSLGFDHQTLKK